jgi:hypothetical protein
VRRRERALGLVSIVRPAQQVEILDGRLAAAADRLPMIELHEPTLRASSTRLAHERALSTVALVHRPAHLRRDAPRIGRLVTRLPGARTGRRAEPLFLHLRDQGVERAIDHHREVTRRVAVAQQRPRALQLLVRRPADRQLQSETLGRKRLHACS